MKEKEKRKVGKSLGKTFLIVCYKQYVIDKSKAPTPTNQQKIISRE
jgi:hypothetical protein